MHIAAAMHRNVVSIFGSTVEEFGFYPPAETSRVLERPGLYCRPCSHIGREKCPEGHFRCMKETDTDSVLGAVLEMVDREAAEEPRERA